MFERLQSNTTGGKLRFGLIALAGLGLAAHRKISRQHAHEAEGSAQVPGTEFSFTQLERASNALLPFVDEWKLSLNPEQVDLMAYAALRHASSEQPLESAENYTQIDRDVRGLIADDRARHARMLETWQSENNARN